MYLATEGNEFYFGVCTIHKGFSETQEDGMNVDHEGIRCNSIEIYLHECLRKA